MEGAYINIKLIIENRELATGSLFEKTSRIFQNCKIENRESGTGNRKLVPYYAPPQKVAGYYVIPSELLSVCPSVRPSAVDHSCPLHNFDTVRDNFTKLVTNIKHDQTTCRD